MWAKITTLNEKKRERNPWKLLLALCDDLSRPGMLGKWVTLTGVSPPPSSLSSFFFFLQTCFNYAALQSRWQHHMLSPSLSFRLEERVRCVLSGWLHHLLGRRINVALSSVSWPVGKGQLTQSSRWISHSRTGRLESWLIWTFTMFTAQTPSRQIEFITTTCNQCGGYSPMDVVMLLKLLLKINRNNNNSKEQNVCVSLPVMTSLCRHTPLSTHQWLGSITYQLSKKLLVSLLLIFALHS